MLLEEYLEENDLFGSIMAIEFLPFMNDDSNQHLSFNYGCRTMSNNALKVDVDMLASFIVDMFNDKWDSLWSSKLSSYELGSKNKIVTENVKNITTDSTGGNETTNKVSGFNTPDLVTDTGSDNTETKNVVGVEDSTTTNYQLNLKSLYDNLSLADKTNIIKTVQNDIANYITIHIY